MNFIYFYVAALLLQVTSANVLPAYLWPLAYIYNNTVPVTPPLAVHGNVVQGKDQSLDFDGKTGWIDAGDFTGQCIAQPSLCKDGLSLGLRVKLNSIQNSDKAFVFDSGGHLGSGVSFYIKTNYMFFEVGSSKRLWQLKVPLESNKWHFILLTWSSTLGLKLFIDGPLVANTRQTQSSVTTIDVGNNITIGKANHNFEVTNGWFSIEMVAIFNKYVAEGKVMLSYSYSPPNSLQGNIRYVKARFMNQGEQAIQIFPDRGAKKTSGYLIMPKTSTLLEFVLREGPLPYGIDFTLKKNDTGESIKFNGKNFVHVGASDDSQVLAEIAIGNDLITNLVYSTLGITPEYDLNIPSMEKIHLNNTLVHGVSVSSFAPDKVVSVESMDKYHSAALSNQNNQENIILVNETNEISTTPITQLNVFADSEKNNLSFVEEKQNVTENKQIVEEKFRMDNNTQEKNFTDSRLQLKNATEINETNQIYTNLNNSDLNSNLKQNDNITSHSNITLCKTCKPDEVTISNEQSTNVETMLDGLKILSAIKGSINISLSNVTNLFDNNVDCSESGINKCNNITTTSSTISTTTSTTETTTTTMVPTVALTTKLTTTSPTTTFMTTTSPTTTTTSASPATTTTTSTSPATTTTTTQTTTSPLALTTISTALISAQSSINLPWHAIASLLQTTAAPTYNIFWTPSHQLPLYKDSHWTFKLVETPKPPSIGCFKYGDLEICSTTPHTSTTSTTTVTTTSAPVTTIPPPTFGRRTTKSFTHPPPLITKYITNPSPTARITNTTTKSKATKSAVKFLGNNCICRPVTAFILPCCLQLVRMGAYSPVSGAVNGYQPVKPCFYPNCVGQVYGQTGTMLLTPNTNGQYNVMQSPVISFNGAEGMTLASQMSMKQQQDLLSTYYKQQHNQQLVTSLQQKYLTSIQKPQSLFNGASLLKKPVEKQINVLSQPQKPQPNVYQSAFYQNKNFPNFLQYSMASPQSISPQKVSQPQSIYSLMNSKFQSFYKPVTNPYFYNQPIVNDQNSLYNQKYYNSMQGFGGYPLNTVSSFGDIGSPQVVNWKNQYIKARSEMGEHRDSLFKHENPMEEQEIEFNKYIKLTPNKLWRNSMIITLGEDSSNETAPKPELNRSEKDKHLTNYGVTETFSGYIGKTILLTDIEGNNITSAPELEVHGTIKKWQGGLKFDGKTSWINATKIDAPFLCDPSLSKEGGFAIGLKLMFDSSIKRYKQPKYILDAGGIDGRGLTLFIEDGILFCILSLSGQTWQTSANLTIDEWIYLSIAWKPSVGLLVYINGIKVADSLLPTLINTTNSLCAGIILGANINHDEETFLLMYLSAFDVMNTYVEGKQLMDFAPPILKDNYIITFSSLDGDSLSNHPNIKVVGAVTENRGVLVLNGMQTFLYDTGDFKDTFVMMPFLSDAGLTFVVKFKYEYSAMKELDEKFIIDSGGWLGNGVSLFVFRGELTAVVSSKGRVWVTQTTGTFTSWCLVLVTWREDMGIYMYLNGALVAKERLSRFLVSELKFVSNFTVGCSMNKGETSYGRFQIAMLSFFPTYTSIDELMKISPPLVLFPTFDWFLLLIQNNRTLTSPSLRVFGDVQSTENGLTFDGETGWVETDLLEDFSEEKAEIICEHFQKDIACPSYQSIKVVYVNYGRTSDIPCQGRRKYIITNCKSVGSLTKAKEMCDGKTICTMKSLNSVWGNTCPGVVKYLDIRYQCIGKVHQDASELQLGAHFLTNPSLARSGLTILVKVRLSKMVDNYTTPHFILDSGGHHGKGVSLYAMNKRLYCTLSTNESIWEVSTFVRSQDWLFVLITWRKDQGLVLYINGNIKATSTKPSLNSGQSTAAATFVLGKSVFNETNSFSQFQVTTFTVLKTYVPRSESFRLFSYYIGRSIASSYESFSSSINQDTVIVCEYQSKTILCPSDQYIEIVFANYGRTSQRPCAWGTHRETNCSLTNAVDIARKECNGKNSCEVVAKNSMWKINPCPGIIKYVEVKYICDGASPQGAVSSQYVGSEDPNSLVIP